MAAVAKNANQRGDVLISPKGYEFVFRSIATANITRLDAVVIDAAVAPGSRYDSAVKPAVTEVVIAGIALHDAIAGNPVEWVTQAELTGFTGLTPGARLSITAGVLDDAAVPAGAVYLAMVINPERIYWRS